LKANICLHLLSVQDSGKVLWTYSGTVPFFSSPHCSDSSVFIGSVNGHIIGISHFGDTVREKGKVAPRKDKLNLCDFNHDLKSYFSNYGHYHHWSSALKKQQCSFIPLCIFALVFQNPVMFVVIFFLLHRFHPVEFNCSVEKIAFCAPV